MSTAMALIVGITVCNRCHKASCSLVCSAALTRVLKMDSMALYSHLHAGRRAQHTGVTCSLLRVTAPELTHETPNRYPSPQHTYTQPNDDGMYARRGCAADLRVEHVEKHHEVVRQDLELRAAIRALDVERDAKL